MSEDVHESGYRCTCCGARGPYGEAACSCADQKCPTCPRCVVCCKTPALHRQGYKTRSERKTPAPVISIDDRMFLKHLAVSWGDEHTDQQKAA